MNKTLLTALCFSLFACGGGGSGGDSKAPTAVVTNSDDSLKIIGNDTIQTFNKPKSADIKIIGDSNFVYAKTNVTVLDIAGDNNNIDLAAGVVVSSCKVSGNNNKLTKADTTPIQCSTVGINNQGFK